jgi:hypothetical protein
MRITISTKRALERKIEGATWGLLLIWAGVYLAVDHMKAGVPALVAGSILLASAMLQRAIGGDAGIMYWGSGLGFALWGLNDLVNKKHDFPVLATVLILVGLFVLLRALGASHRPHLTLVRHHRRGEEGPPRPPVEL